MLLTFNFLIIWFLSISFIIILSLLVFIIPYMILYHLIQQLYSLSFLNSRLLCKFVFANFIQYNAFWLHSVYTQFIFFLFPQSSLFWQVSSPHLGLLLNLVSSEFYLGHLSGHGFRGIYWSIVSLTLKIITHIHL